jgi:hypothetical protein
MIGSKKKIGRQCCWDYRIGGSGYMFMLLKVIGKIPKFWKLPEKRDRSSQVVFPSSQVVFPSRGVARKAGLRVLPLSFSTESLNKRFYTSTSCCFAEGRKSADFWYKVNSKKIVNEMNPHYLVERFFQNNRDRALAKSNIDLDLINRIMSLHLPGFSLTLENFNLLKNIEPQSIDYPFELHLPEIIGKPSKKGEGKAGVYLFTNINNGDRYVGSSINLAMRLKKGYFGKLPIVGQRKIEVSIREHGLANFHLDAFLIPSIGCVNSSGVLDKKTLQHLVLSLEQMLILEINPELNEIKIAGSSPGVLTSKNLRNSYLYDEQNKELIYVVNGRKNLAEIFGWSEGVIKRYLEYKNKLYLNRFFVADDVLSGEEYTTNIMSLSELQAYLEKIRLGRKAYLSKVVPSREETHLKFCKPVELTHLVTKESWVFGSLTKVTQFIGEYDPEFSKVSKSTLSHNAKTGIPYKGIFKIRYID